MIRSIQEAIHLCESIEGSLVCDKKGYIEYGFWTDTLSFTSNEVRGMHILELYPSLTTETSKIMQVLKTGVPCLQGGNQHLTNYKGEPINCIGTVLPIFENGEILGALSISTPSSNYTMAEYSLEKSFGQLYTLDDIITQNESMLRIKSQLCSVAIHHSTVLIYGETGTGKELFAHAIHLNSSRRDHPFISQNCAAIPSSLLESIFFGTEKGSYTGAESKQGLLEMAHGGTLFLDEINSMDISIQAKLLKVLEEKKVRRLGGNKDIYFDVRIVCALNENPLGVLRKGTMREDLFYRICVVQLTIPPLRDRKDDIPLLTHYFIAKYNREMNVHIQGLSDLVRKAFEEHSWPGNVRELKNTIESAFNVVKTNIITIADLPSFFFWKNEPVNTSMTPPLPENTSLSQAVDLYEKQLIEGVLNSSKNMAETAKKLKISRQNLKYKLEKYDLK